LSLGAQKAIGCLKADQVCSSQDKPFIKEAKSSSALIRLKKTVNPLSKKAAKLYLLQHRFTRDASPKHGFRLPTIAPRNSAGVRFFRAGSTRQKIGTNPKAKCRARLCASAAAQRRAPRRGDRPRQLNVRNRHWQDEKPTKNPKPISRKGTD